MSYKLNFCIKNCCGSENNKKMKEVWFFSASGSWCPLKGGGHQKKLALFRPFGAQNGPKTQKTGFSRSQGAFQAKSLPM